MPKISKYGDAFTDAQRLLVAMRENESLMPNIEIERSELESMLVRAQDAQSRQDFHNSERQKATQDLKLALDRYKEAAIQIRTVAKAVLGVRNAKLAQFRVVPLGRRKPRTAGTTTPTIKNPVAAPAEPVTEGTKPAA